MVQGSTGATTYQMGQVKDTVGICGRELVTGVGTRGNQLCIKYPAGVQPRWIQGDSKVGTESASLEKYIFNHRYREIRNG